MSPQVTALVWALSSSGARPSIELSDALTEELWGRRPGAFSAREVCVYVCVCVRAWKC
jgi:hypothetical protein